MKYLYVGAMDQIDREVLEAIRGRVEGEFGLPVREIGLPGPEFAYDARRNQYGSAPILEELTRICPADARKLLAVTRCDLFIPVLTFVYGQAQLGGRVAVVSLARLRQEFYGLPADRPVFFERAHKEALHETGHLFGLVHCGDAGCAMSLATNIRQVDRKRAGLCEECAGRLRRDRERAVSEERNS